jgi:type I restriction enzyme S subunit
VATILNGAAFKSKLFSPDDGVPLIRIRDIARGETSTRYSGEYDDRYLIQPGELLVGMDGDFNVARWRGSAALLNQRVCRISPDTKTLDLDFLTSVLPGYLQAIHDVTSSTTVKHLSSRDIADIPIPLPTLSDQQRIVARLIEVEDDLGSIGAHLQTARTVLERLRSAVLAAACSGRLTEDWRKDHPDATVDQLHAELIEVGQTAKVGRAPASGEHGLTSGAQLELLPPSWSLVRLGDILDVSTGATPLRKNQAYYDDGTIPWVTSGAVNVGTITSPTELITPLALEETNVKLFPPGTLLVAMYGEGQTRGRVAELAIEAGTNQAVAAVLFTKATAPLRPFIRLFFEDSYQRVRALSAGGVQPNLNLGVIKDTLLPLPPPEEQAVIVRRATVALEAADRLATQIEQLEGTLDRISRAALTKAFRGELVPTEAALAAEEGRDFESAEELLARVVSGKGDRSESGRRR